MFFLIPYYLISIYLCIMSISSSLAQLYVPYTSPYPFPKHLFLPSSLPPFAIPRLGVSGRNLTKVATKTNRNRPRDIWKCDRVCAFHDAEQ